MSLYVLCGIPASGKTTLSRQLTEQYNAKLHCFDDLPKAHHPQYYKEVRRKMHIDIADDLRSGFNVVCDDLNTTKQWREDILSAIADVECEKVLIVMTTPLEECIQRNRQRKARLPDFVLEDTYRNFQPPEITEGWEQILYYKEGDNI